jgi:hypothetical protein
MDEQIANRHWIYGCSLLLSVMENHKNLSQKA